LHVQSCHAPTRRLQSRDRPGWELFNLGIVLISEEGGSADANQDVANLGLVRPPVVYLVAIAIGSALEFVWSLPFFPRAFAIPLGILLAVAAVALFVASTGKFRAAGTSVPGNEPTTAIIRAG